MEKFISNMFALHGEEGQIWLDRVPETIEFLVKKWQLSALKPFSNLTYHYVLAGMRADGRGAKPIVLKLGFDRTVLQQEVSALRAFGGGGCAKLLAYDDVYGALLIERVVPGIALSTYFPARDEEAVQIACGVMSKLHSVESIDLTLFPKVESWLLTLDKPWDIPVRYLEKARVLRDSLLATAAAPVLLHGDLHHDNILLNSSVLGDEWWAIDPKGVVGEPAYEVGAFLRNPDTLLSKHSDIKQIIKVRIALFASQMNLDLIRIRDWGFVQLVMCACWAVEDGGSPGEWLVIADGFDKT